MRRADPPAAPERPTLRMLAQLNGDPPWELEVPYPDALPPEAADLIGAVVMGGARFVREGRGGGGGL